MHDNARTATSTPEPGSDLQPRLGRVGSSLSQHLCAPKSVHCARLSRLVSEDLGLFFYYFQVSKGKISTGVFFSSAPHHFSLLVPIPHPRLPFSLSLAISFIITHRPVPALPLSISHEPSRHALVRFSFFHSFCVPCSFVPGRAGRSRGLPSAQLSAGPAASCLGASQQLLPAHRFHRARRC